MRKVTRTFIVATVALAALTSGLAARQLSPRPTADWIERLERPERVAGLKIDQVIAHLGLKPGQVVADIGAGSGLFSLPLAKAVAPVGKVYAVDVDQGFLDFIDKKAKTENVPNVKTVLGKFTDPNLPARDVDLAFFNDVLHHIDKRADYLKTLAHYIKPGGRIAVIELDAKTGSHKNEPALQVTKDRLDAWMRDAGFKPVQQVAGVYDDGKWFVIYGR